MTPVNKGKSKGEQVTEECMVRDNSITPAILEAMRNGDHDAFHKVYLAFVRRVYAFLKYMTRSDDEAEEFTQEVFVKLWEKREYVDSSKALEGYIFAIAKNVTLQHWRSRDRSPVTSVEIHDDSASDNRSADNILALSDIELLVKIAVSRMPPMQRKVYEMSVEQGLDTKEIAEALNISASSVFSYLSNARKLIRQLMGVIMLFFG